MRTAHSISSTRLGVAAYESENCNIIDEPIYTRKFESRGRGLVDFYLVTLPATFNSLHTLLSFFFLQMESCPYINAPATESLLAGVLEHEHYSVLQNTSTTTTTCNPFILNVALACIYSLGFSIKSTSPSTNHELRAIHFRAIWLYSQIQTTYQTFLNLIIQ